MLPAYGRELVELRRSGFRPAGKIYITDDWTAAKSLRDRGECALVEPDCAAQLDFSALAGLPVVFLRFSSRRRRPIENARELAEDIESIAGRERKALRSIRMARPASLELQWWNPSRDDPEVRAREDREVAALIARAERILAREAA